MGAIALGWIASDVHPAGVAGEAHLATAEKGRVTAEHYARQVIGVLGQITVQDISGYAPVPDPFR